MLHTSCPAPWRSSWACPPHMWSEMLQSWPGKISPFNQVIQVMGLSALRQPVLKNLPWNNPLKDYLAWENLSRHQAPGTTLETRDNNMHSDNLCRNNLLFWSVFLELNMGWPYIRLDQSPAWAKKNTFKVWCHWFKVSCCPSGRLVSGIMLKMCVFSRTHCLGFIVFMHIVFGKYWFEAHCRG